MLGELSWKRLLSEVVVVYLLAGLCALLFGYTGWCLFVATAVLLLWHFYQLRKLSKWLWDDISYYPPEGKGSWLSVFYGIHKMRAEQRKERKRLSDLISYFRRGAERFPDAYILASKEGHLIWCNQKAIQLLGLRWPQDQNQLILHLIRNPEFIRYFRAQNYDQPLTLQVTEKHYYEFRIVYPYIDGQLLMVVRDVSEQISLENMRKSFFVNVSHELRIPLTVIQGYIELLSTKDQLSSLEEKAFKHMQEQVNRLNDMTTQLLTLSKLEQGAGQELKQEVGLSKMVEKLVESYTERNPEGTQVTLNIPENEEFLVFINESQISMVLNNLFYNAIEHNPENTPVSVTLKRHGHAVECLIEDKGNGIPKEHLPRLTERFYRVSSARNRDVKNVEGGSGLGLAIVKYALENHNSKLEIESVEGQGSIFKFSLPIVVRED